MGSLDRVFSCVLTVGGFACLVLECAVDAGCLQLVQALAAQEKPAVFEQGKFGGVPEQLLRPKVVPVPANYWDGLFGSWFSIPLSFNRLPLLQLTATVFHSLLSQGWSVSGVTGGVGVIEQPDYVAPKPPSPALSSDLKKLELERVHEAFFEVDPIAAERMWKCLTYMARAHDHAAAERNFLFDTCQALKVPQIAFAAQEKMVSLRIV